MENDTHSDKEKKQYEIIFLNKYKNVRKPHTQCNFIIHFFILDIVTPLIGSYLIVLLQNLVSVSSVLIQ